MKKNHVVDANTNELLNTYADDQLDEKRLKVLLNRLDEEPELRAALSDIQRVKGLLQMAYPFTLQPIEKPHDEKRMLGIAASLLMALGLGFGGGHLTSGISHQEVQVAEGTLNAMHATANFKHTEFDPSTDAPAQKVIIYLGSSKAEKRKETLDKAEALLINYKKNGAQVYVVTSAGGLELLRTGNQETEARIMKMKGIYKSLSFIACNNQIYKLHKEGKVVNLVDNVQVAPSAVQFVVNHLKKGWKFIAI
ncbi:MAG: hypothetical protein V3U64_00055 [Cocleimonas sp.]